MLTPHKPSVMGVIDVSIDFPGLRANPPASESMISTAEEKIGARLPSSYREFLLGANGGEGTVGDGYVQLWPVQDVRVDTDRKLGTAGSHKFILIGSDGGGETICILIKGDKAEFGIVPSITMTLDDRIKVSDDLFGLLRRAGHWLD